MNFEKIINNEWYKVLEAQFRAPYFSSLTEFVKHERETKEVLQIPCSQFIQA